jgi:hypothetical protein
VVNLYRLDERDALLDEAEFFLFRAEEAANTFSSSVCSAGGSNIRR